MDLSTFKRAAALVRYLSATFPSLKSPFGRKCAHTDNDTPPAEGKKAGLIY